jgi:twitching motility protein PilT
MIVNNTDDLLPLGAGKESGSPKDQNEFLAARVAETFDSVELLMAARAEAELAEARAKSLPETPLPFVQEHKAAKSPPAAAPTSVSHAPLSPGGGYAPATSARDEDSPAFGLLGAELGRLSDARGIGLPSAQDYLVTDQSLLDAPSPADARMMENGQTLSLDDVHIDELLRLTVQCGASDLHLTIGLPPMIRKDGRLVPLPYDRAVDRDIQRIVYDILNNHQIETFERVHELDFSYGVKGIGRFRFNVYKQRSSVGCAMRVIPNNVPTMEQLKLPPILRELTRKHSGLVLVTGPTGSGKSTTIASMIDIINTERECHILTIEDPIEYLHQHKKSMVNQRELGTDTDTFYNALRASLREDPDVILVGEMRDLETISAAITLAETGHLVFATLHTRSAPATIDRIVDVFPSHQQEQIRIQLSTSIEAVVAQQLLPKLGGGRISAIEVMIATSALRNLIREGKTYQIYSVIETGQQYGMQTMDRMLAELHRGGHVSFEEAVTRSIDRENFLRLVKGY